METTINKNKETLESMVKEVEAIFPAAFPAGYMDRQIRRRGFYEEEGLRFIDKDYAVGQLYAGLAVLARDMHQYVVQNSRDDSALFEEVISLVNAEEGRLHGSKAFPDYEGLPVDILHGN